MNSDHFQNYPQFNTDLFSDDALTNSAPLYQKIRDLGDAVWCPYLDMFLVGRFDDVKSGLLANEILISGEGVTLNAHQNGEFARQNITTIQADGEQHKRLKNHSMKPLRAPQIKKMRQKIEKLADDQVKLLLNKGQTEGLDTLAFYMPVNTVCDLVGINGVGSERMKNWSEALFNTTGPIDQPRTMSNMDALADFQAFLAPITRADLKPGSWADKLFEASEQGEITEDEARGMLADYIIPSLDTTAQSIAELLYQLSVHPEALAKIKEHPELISGTVLEAVRLATPIRGFTRFLADDFRLSETTIPKGCRVWLLNASANLDERVFRNPEAFDIERNPKYQLGWGYGVHLCIGKHLAKLEMEALLSALSRHVQTIEISEPKRIINNMIQGYRSLPISLKS